MKKRSLKIKLSMAIVLVSLLTIALISVLSNLFTNQQFKRYLAKQQEEKTQEMVASLSGQYNNLTGKWDMNFLHTIGMYALYDGYIVKIYDLQSNILWDAEECDMSACMQVMNDISTRMQNKYPQINGEFTSKDYDLMQDGQIVGMVNISYFSPLFLSENDFHFLDTINQILIYIGILSLVISIIVGWFMSKRVSTPILKTVYVAKQMSDGDYAVRIKETTDTKELNILINSINHLAESLEKQEKLRKQLTGDVAHELRTPLTTLGTHIEAMIEGIWQPTSERLQSCYDEIIRISKLVTDLESLAKIESDTFKLEKKQIDLSEIVAKVLCSFEIEVKNKNLKLSQGGTCSQIYADSDRVSQVVYNLVSNAIKYTPRDGNIEIQLSETSDGVILTVKDDGIGIPDDEIPFIFERFFRADKSRNRKTGGSGLGLAIVKSIVVAHEGKINLESQLDHGSCFKITLPKKRDTD